MPGLGTIINIVMIIAGGILGMLIGRLLNERLQASLVMACGISVLFIGSAGALSGILSVSGDGLTAGRSMLIVLCLILGAFVGELLNIEGWFEDLGEWLKVKSGSTGDNRFINSFLSASLTVSIGAMAVVGPINDVFYGDYSILVAKGVLDLIIVMVLTASSGKGALFSFVPVGIIQGTMSLLAVLIRPVMTDPALDNLSLIGSILIFCVGLNLVWGKKVRVANLLPALIFAVAAAFLPLNL